MGRVVVSEFVSIDGVMEAPGGEPDYRHTGWVSWYPDEGQFEYKFREVVDHEALLLGRVTYESFAGAWPGYEGEFADRMNSMPKYVVSTTLKDPEWNNTHVLEGDPMGAVARLKGEMAGDMVVGGSRTLVNALRQADLVDEYRLMVFPVVLGSGRRLFDRMEDAQKLKLVDSRSFGSISLLTYQRVREDAGG